MYPCAVHMNRVRWPSLDWREEIRQTKDVRQSGRCAGPFSIKTGEYGASSRSALLKIKDGGEHGKTLTVKHIISSLWK